MRYFIRVLFGFVVEFRVPGPILFGVGSDSAGLVGRLLSSRAEGKRAKKR